MNLPTKNSTGLPAVELSEEQKYLFDTRGWLLIPNALTAGEVEEMREFCVRLRTDKASIPIPERNSLGGPLIQLTDHPVVLGFMNEFVADPYGWGESAYGFRLENSFLAHKTVGDANFSPHGGHGLDSFGYNSHLYRQREGKVYAGLTRAVWELNPVKHGDGGTKFLTGSHKAAFKTPASTQNENSPLWEDYECPAGSVLFFTEAMTHTGSTWTNPNVDRYAIFNCYNSIGSRWHQWEPNSEQLASMSALHRSLFRQICCDRNMG